VPEVADEAPGHGRTVHDCREDDAVAARLIAARPLDETQIERVRVLVVHRRAPALVDRAIGDVDAGVLEPQVGAREVADGHAVSPDLMEIDVVHRDVGRGGVQQHGREDVAALELEVLEDQMLNVLAVDETEVARGLVRLDVRIREEQAALDVDPPARDTVRVVDQVALRGDFGNWLAAEVEAQDPVFGWVPVLVDAVNTVPFERPCRRGVLHEVTHHGPWRCGIAVGADMHRQCGRARHVREVPGEGRRVVPHTAALEQHGVAPVDERRDLTDRLPRRGGCQPSLESSPLSAEM
jgi:hypothetical protein